jgi:hypothetical protein
MWEKLSIRERERRLGMLFHSVLLAVVCGVVLTVASPAVGGAVVGSVAGIYGVVVLRRSFAMREGKYGRTPVGPLSPDEKNKARSKLLTARRQG